MFNKFTMTDKVTGQVFGPYATLDQITKPFVFDQFHWKVVWTPNKKN